MKKVLKLILLVAMIASLSVCAFAADSPELVNVPVDEANASELVSAVAEVPEDIEVEITAADEEMTATNEEAAKAADPDAVILDSFDINVTNAATGEALHEGATVTLTLNVSEEFIGYLLKLYEDGVLNQTVTITGTTVTLVINSFSTYTPVIVKPAEGTVTPTTPETSPQTMQSILPFALAGIAVLALAGAVYARKRSFN